MPTTFWLEPMVARQFTGTRINLVGARGVQNDHQWSNLEEKLAELEDLLSRHEWEPPSENDVAISSWHDAYRRFGTNPRRSRPSVEALSRRLRRNGRLPRINPAVDAYNLVSVMFRIPPARSTWRNLPRT